VESVIVDGRLVMQDRRILTVDEAEVREAIERVIPGVRKSLSEVRSRLAPIEGKLQLAAAKTWATDIGVHRFIGHNIMERGK
jgi:hypothetical protein